MYDGLRRLRIENKFIPLDLNTKTVLRHSQCETALVNQAHCYGNRVADPYFFGGYCEQ